MTQNILYTRRDRNCPLTSDPFNTIGVSFTRASAARLFTTRGVPGRFLYDTMISGPELFNRYRCQRLISVPVREVFLAWRRNSHSTMGVSTYAVGDLRRVSRRDAV